MSHNVPREVRPATVQDLIDKGYKFEGTATCKACGANMEWWRTDQGRRAPYNPSPSGESIAVSHFATCPQAAKFRKKRDHPSLWS